MTLPITLLACLGLDVWDVCILQTFQNGKFEIHKGIGQPTRMDNNTRSDRHISSCTHQYGLPASPPLCTPQSRIPFLRPSIRLTTAPYVFTRLMRPILTWTHRQGLQLHAYLDDWLLRHFAHSTLLSHLQMTITLLTRLGLQVNFPKSRLQPAQVFDSLGATFNTLTMTIAPTTLRVEALIASIQNLFNAPSFYGPHACYLHRDSRLRSRLGSIPRFYPICQS